jgi:type II secretory ATPase GspE/PulE/Tfp pilus assembly ATPase PilB-like protein
MIASSLTGILAQRLIRRLCTCRTFQQVTPQYAARLRAVGSTHVPDQVAWPAGCELCDQSGFKGRVGVYELLVVDESIRSLLRGEFKPDLIRNAAQANGMRPLQEDAMDKLWLGLTTLEEIQRVIPFAALSSTECARCGHELLPVFHYCPFCGIKRNNGNTPSDLKSPVPIEDKVLLA